MESMDSSTVLAPNVIVADDDEMSLILLQDGLKGMGFQLTGCGNGKDALLMSLKRPPDAMLLDDRMPGLDSLKTIKMIRIMEPIRALPVILLAESPDKDTVIRAMQMGATDCISKNSSLHDISLRLQRAIKMPVKQAAPLFETLRYFFHYDGAALTLDIECEITTECGKNLIELIRSLTGLMPVKLLLNMDKVPSIAASGIGYLSDVKDTVANCGGTIALSHIDLNRYQSNVRRFLEKYFQIEVQAVAEKNSP